MISFLSSHWTWKVRFRVCWIVILSDVFDQWHTAKNSGTTVVVCSSEHSHSHVRVCVCVCVPVYSRCLRPSSSSVNNTCVWVKVAWDTWSCAFTQSCCSRVTQHLDIRYTPAELGRRESGRQWRKLCQIMSLTMLTTNAYILLCVSVHNTGQNTHLHNNNLHNINVNAN